MCKELTPFCASVEKTPAVARLHKALSKHHADNMPHAANAVDWNLPGEVITKEKVQWAIKSFAPFKSAGMDGIFPTLIQCGEEILISHMCKIFTASIAFGYIPEAWRQVKVVFIPQSR